MVTPEAGLIEFPDVDETDRAGLVLADLVDHERTRALDCNCVRCRILADLDGHVPRYSPFNGLWTSQW